MRKLLLCINLKNRSFFLLHSLEKKQYIDYNINVEKIFSVFFVEGGTNNTYKGH